jgi:hypothetical protein
VLGREPTVRAARARTVAPRPTRVGLISAMRASRPLTKLGESSVDSEVASDTASEMATPSGMSSA